MSPEIRVVFLGTPAFSVPTLQALLAASHIRVLGVVTQPDKPAGRGNKLTPPPIKVLAEEAGLPVYQPKSIRKNQEVLAWLREQAPDFLVTVAFGQILSQEVLDIPRLGTVNVHASLLPELRGANPIQASILQGKPETGLTTMLTDIGVDTGAMLLRDATPIGPDETAAELAERLSTMGGPLLLRTLEQLYKGELTPEPQDHDRATHAPKGVKEDAHLDWSHSAQSLHNRIRGQQPWPGAVTLFNGERLKILRSRLAGKESEDLLNSGEPGRILGIIKSGVQVRTGDGVLEILEVQPAGKRAMPARDWAQGALKNPGDSIHRFESILEIPV